MQKIQFSQLSKEEVDTMWKRAVKEIEMGGLSTASHNIYNALYNALHSEWELSKKNYKGMKWKRKNEVKNEN